MELEDIKQIWKNQDEKLDVLLKTNEILLRKINFNKIKQNFKGTLNLELINLWVIPILTIHVVLVCFHYEWKSSLPWAFTLFVVFAILSFVFYSKRYRLLKSLLQFDLSLTGSLNKLIYYEAYFNKFKKFEFILSPLFGFCLLYIIDFHTFLKSPQHFYYIFIFFAILVTFLLFIYNYYFKRKIENTFKLLSELKEFESPE
jgi:hypothetical protein